MKYKSLFVLLLLLSAAGFAACNLIKKSGDGAAAAPVQEEEVVYAVNAYTVRSGRLDAYLELGGDVSAAAAVDVLPDMAGKITRVLAGVGDSVTKGQIIAYVDASRPGMNYRESPVKAPAAGRITAFLPAAGAMVSQSVAIAKISSTDDLDILVSVAERFVSRVRPGADAAVSFDAYPDVTFHARVSELSPVLDASSRTMAVKLRLTPPDARVKVGMYARVRLITASVPDAVIIPASAVLSRDGKSYVFTVSRAGAGTVALLQPVVLGMQVDGDVQVTEGLVPGNEIVSKGQSLLNDGARINVVSAAGVPQ